MSQFQKNDKIAVLGPKKLGLMILVGLVTLKEYYKNDELWQSLQIVAISRNASALSVCAEFNVPCISTLCVSAPFIIEQVHSLISHLLDWMISIDINILFKLFLTAREPVLDLKPQFLSQTEKFT